MSHAAASSRRLSADRRPALESLERRRLLAAAATGLSAKAVSQSEVNLTWNLADATDTSVVVQRKTAAGAFQTLATLPGGESIFTDTSGYSQTAYTYRVQTVDAAGGTALSNEASATTVAVASGSMALTTGLVVTATSSTTATVSFTDTNAGVKNHEHLVERSADGVSYQLVQDTGPGTSWTDTGLRPGATYRYRVRSIAYGYGPSEYTAPAAVTLPARTANVPIEPNAVRAVNNSAVSNTVTWAAGDASGAAFKVERATFDQYKTLVWKQVGLTAAGATSFTDTTAGLLAEHAYVYRVKATSAAGDSSYGRPAGEVDHSLFGDAVGVVTASTGTGSAKTYDIGPGRTYAKIADLDWRTLGPGDTVNIHYKPGGYHELFMISTRGTAAAGITINGVPDPATGALPTIDGDQAVLAPQFANHYAPINGMGGIVVGTRAGYVQGYNPGYLTVQNLDVRNVYKGNAVNTFTTVDGTKQAYTDVGAGIYLERADHVLLKNNTVTNNGEGIFGAGQYTFDRLMTNITLDGNTISNNGNVGSYLEHNTYLEGIDTVYQNNRYGPVRVGSLGAGLKDRSVNPVIRFNSIEGGAHQLQLPEAQNQAALALTLPSYHRMLVYGNYFLTPPGNAASPILYGGDQGTLPYYRKGVLYLYNNTFVQRGNQTGTNAVYRYTVVDLASSGESADVRNNIIASVPETAGQAHSDQSLLSPVANAYFGRNWVSPNYRTSFNAFTGHVEGLSNLQTGPTNDPGFVSLSAGDYHLASTSVVIDRQVRLPGTTDAYPVTREFAAPATAVPRPVTGAASDLGADEYTPLVTPGAPTAVISGVMFDDTNRDGRRADDEAVLPGRNVYLDTNNDGVNQPGEISTITDINGQYRFTVAPGGHVVRFAPVGGYGVVEPASGFFRLTVEAGTTNADNDIALSTPGRTGHPVAGTAASPAATPPAATPPAATPPATGVVRGAVFNDWDLDNVRDTGEQPAAGAVVYADANLNGSRDPGEASTVTDATGAYTLTLAVGSHTLAVVAPANTRAVAAASPVSVAAGSTIARDFGTTTKALVTGVAFLDTNRNGLRDAGEAALSAWRAYVDANDNGLFDPGEASVLTDATGQYALTPYAVGTAARVRLTAPKGPSPATVYALTPAAGKTYAGRDFAVA